MTERTVELRKQPPYCGSRWPHKPHRWYDAKGKEQECAGREREPGERIPSDPKSRG